LVTVVAQHARTNAVLMVAFANREAIEESIGTGEMHFYSRARQRLWRKGESSGHILRVIELLVDCDKDTVLARVEPFGPTCHTGAVTCFGEPSVDAIRKLEAVVHKRATKPPKEGEVSYTRELLSDRNLRLKKVGEEAGELMVALADGDKARMAEEAADLVYHVVVALHAAGVPFDEVRKVLDGRGK
jgi:phosphoribosyl-AMP cyclohydrolase / phosphoribosyl-ATP pyrophosphohydrolase